MMDYRKRGSLRLTWKEKGDHVQRWGLLGQILLPELLRF